ncbi:four-helix bundle copper-binding protein [Chlorogloeopsis sp. ULAP02]|uniref:four-helix bundle copper-binding protein n=1 Tax=Chlorogloeopsis sp. ULAP02 TaxID=3107926 RepID=UPI003134AD4E
MITESTITELEVCRKACTDCYKICIEILNYCKIQGGKYIDMTMVLMIRDCAEMCMMCINTIDDGSEFMGRICALCAEMCDRAAMVCEQMSDDAKMMECAVACRKCSEYCYQMGLQSASYFRRSSLVNEESLLYSCDTNNWDAL